MVDGGARLHRRELHSRNVYCLQIRHFSSRLPNEILSEFIFWLGAQ